MQLKLARVPVRFVILALSWIVYLKVDLTLPSDLIQNKSSTSVPAFSRSVQSRNSIYHPLLPSKSVESPVPEPVQIVQEYISWHSAQALGAGVTSMFDIRNNTDDNNKNNRKYILVEYSCPQQAGNVMSRFLNAFLLAIATNRTLLVTYGNSFAEKRGINPGTVQDCHQILHRATWLPFLNDTSQVNEWLTMNRDRVYQLRQKIPVRHSCHEMASSGTTGPVVSCPAFMSANPDLASQLAIRAHGGAIGGYPIIDMNVMTGCYQSLTHGWIGRFNLSDPTCYHYLEALFPGEFMDTSRVQMLFRYGLYFCYGMLFRYSFSFSDDLIASVDAVWQQTTSTDHDDAFVTLGVHTRHSNTNDEGTNLDKETKCLDRLLKLEAYPQQEQDRHYNSSGRNDKTTKKCQILIMSDRRRTISELYKYANERECHGLAVQAPEMMDQQNNSSDPENVERRLSAPGEHGPFAGAGFYQDLLLFSQGRNGFVGTFRSSSALVIEAMVYNNVMRRWKRNRTSSFSLPDDSSSGEFCIPLTRGRGCDCIDLRYS